MLQENIHILGLCNGFLGRDTSKNVNYLKTF
jgi:hypothetical protein